MNVRQDGAVQEAEKIAVQRASDRQINLHRISAQTMSMPLNTNKVILTFCACRSFFSLLTFAIFHTGKSLSEALILHQLTHNMTTDCSLN